MMQKRSRELSHAVALRSRTVALTVLRFDGSPLARDLSLAGFDERLNQVQFLDTKGPAIGVQQVVLPERRRRIMAFRAPGYVGLGATVHEAPVPADT